MENHSFMHNESRNTCIQSSLKYIAQKAGRQKLEVTFEELARENNMTFEEFSKIFESLEDCLVACILRMNDLFVRYVQDFIYTATFKKKKKIYYFLRCIKRYLDQYPEAGYLFTMSFLGDILNSPVYPYLEHYFNDWRETLHSCLIECTSEIYAKRLTENFLISIRGQLQLANIEDVQSTIIHTERFLTFTLKYL